ILEALGIAAEGKWDKFMEEWLKKLGSDPTTQDASKDIIWRSRSKSVIPILADLAGDPSFPITQRLRYFRAVDFHPESDLKERVLTDMLREGFRKQDDDLLKWGLKHLNPASFQKSPETRHLVKSRLNQTEGTSEFVELVERYGIYDEKNRLMDI